MKPASLEPLEARIAPAAVVYDRSGSADGAPDELVLARDGAHLTLTINGVLAKSWLFSEVDSLAITGSADDDTLVVALAGGPVLPAGGIDFDGGPGFDTLKLEGGTVGQETHLAYDGHSGVIGLDGLEIRYRAIEPVIDTAGALDFTFTAPAGVQTINIDNGPAAGQVRISSATLSFESITFSNKVNVTIDAGDGSDTINLNGNAATGLSALTILGGSDGAADTFNINGGTRATLLRGGGGDDVFNFADGVTLNGGGIVAGAGANTLDLSAYTTAVVVNLPTVSSPIGFVNGITNVTGGSGNDVITGNASVNILHGGPGNDTLTGGAAADQLYGEAGNDVLIWNNGDGSDVIDGGPDNDAMHVSGATGGDQFLLQVNATDSTHLRFERTNLGLFHLDLGAIEALQAGGNDGDDTFTVDFNHGNPIPVSGLGFDGGAGDNHVVLQRSAGSFVAASESHAALGPGEAAITIDGQLFSMANISGVDDTLPTTALTFTTPEAVRMINLVDGPLVSAVHTAQLNSGAPGFVPVNFAHKTNVAVNANDGDELITLNNPTLAADLASLTVNAAGGADTIINKASTALDLVTLNGGDGADFFKVSAGSTPIHVDGGAPALSPGDVLNVETSGIPAHLGAGVVTSAVHEDITFAGLEKVFLSNHTLRILTPHSAAYQDADGDLVTIRTTHGTLALEDFQLLLNAAENGAQLASINLSALAGDFDGTDLKVTAHRSALGGDGFANVGYLNAAGTDLGAITIPGDLGAIDAGNVLKTAPAVKSLTVQSLGRLGTTSGALDLVSDLLGDVAALKIKGDVFHAEVHVLHTAVEAGRIGRLLVGGSLIGGTAANSGSFFPEGGIGLVQITGDLVGGSGDLSGSVSTGGRIQSALIGGSLIGGPMGFENGQMNANFGFGRVIIRGDLRGNGGTSSGNLGSDGGALSIAVRGALLGGDNPNGGSIELDGAVGLLTVGGDVVGGSAANTGLIRVGRAGRIVLGGSLRAGLVDGAGSIRSAADIASLSIAGNVVGTAAIHATITALGRAVPGPTSDLAIGNLLIRGRAEFAEILAGYDVSGVARNADAQIGSVAVKGDWVRSSIAAGVVAGGDGLFGTGDDAAIDELAATGHGENPAVASRIARIVLQGQVLGTPSGQNSTDHFGFVAQQIGRFLVGPTLLPLQPTGAPDVFEIGITGDVTVREV